MSEFVKLRVLGITYSQIQSGAYALVLAEEDGKRRIPIIIGTAEAQSIAIQLEHLAPPRPLTHDLFVSFAHDFEIQLKEVFIYKYEEGVFSSELHFVDKAGVEKSIDSRTSDAIALALRMEAPIKTTPEIVRQAGIEFDEHAMGIGDASQATVQTSPSSSKDVELLNARLQDAIQKEQYEEASKLRDEIKKIEEVKSESQPKESSSEEKKSDPKADDSAK